MAGCTKADRNRNSAANAKYKLGNVHEINKKRRIAKNERRKAKKAKEIFLGKKTPRGYARKLRRLNTPSTELSI